MTDKEIIERWLKGRLTDLYEESQCELPELPKEVIEGKMLALRETLSFINSLEVKGVDLEKAIDDYIYTHDGRKRLALELDWKRCNLTLKGGDEIIKFAKHFFELGLKAQKGEEV